MKKRSERLIGIAMALVLVLVSIIPVFAQSQTSDPYSNHYSETLRIDGSVYTYTYSYDDSGNRVVTLNNVQSDSINTIIVDKKSGIIQSNEKTIGTIEESSSNTSSVRKAAASSSSWKKESSGTKRISWAKGTTTAAVVAAIAAGLGVTSGSVLLVMGATALGVLAGSTSGGTITWTKYARTRTARKPERKLVWSFKASSGDKYGPYTIMLSQ